jgi:hypothetical protein
VIDWVDESCKSWGRCTRWILSSTNKVGDPEGFPTATTIAKARDGMLSFGVSSGGPRSQQFLEVRRGDALLVARAMAASPHMPLPLTATVWAQYVVEGRARNKLPALNRYIGRVITIAEYWRNLDRAHFFLSARIVEPSQRAAVTPTEARADCSA